MSPCHNELIFCASRLLAAFKILSDTYHGAGVADPKPTCAVVTSPPIRGTNVNMTCNMTYYTHGDDARVSPGLDIFPSIDWEPGAGTPFYTSVTFLRSTSASPVIIGRILQVDMGTMASGEVIPSYNCTTNFWFTNARLRVPATHSTSYRGPAAVHPFLLGVSTTQ